MRLVDRNRMLSCVQGGHRGSAFPADEQQPLAECRTSPNLDGPYLHGEASGALQRSTPFPSVFSHLCICSETE